MTSTDTDIVASIKAAHPPENYDLTIAGGRAVWRRDLRGKIKKIEDDHLRRDVAGEIWDWCSRAIAEVYREMYGGEWV